MGHTVHLKKMPLLIEIFIGITLKTGVLFSWTPCSYVRYFIYFVFI